MCPLLRQWETHQALGRCLAQLAVDVPKIADPGTAEWFPSLEGMLDQITFACLCLSAFAFPEPR